MKQFLENIDVKSIYLQCLVIQVKLIPWGLYVGRELNGVLWDSLIGKIATELGLSISN
jgi:hypothetical protein